MNGLSMTLREFRKAHQSGAFSEAVVCTLPGNAFYVTAKTKNGDTAVLSRSDNNVREFRSLMPTMKLLRSVGFDNVRVSLANWSPAQQALRV